MEKKMEINKVFHIDCIEYMKTLPNNSVNLTLIDIPYGEVNRDSNGLHEARGTTLNKGIADIMTFDLEEFLNEVWRITKGTIIIFCGMTQLSQIKLFFDKKQSKKQGTVRQLIWEKTNPAPFNGQYVYLSGIENAIWFRKSKAPFNAHCKNTVFRYPLGSGKLHPTEKHHGLLKELILDNSNEGDIVFDPCAGSGAHLLVAKENNRQYLDCELYGPYYEIIKGRGL